MGLVAALLAATLLEPTADTAGNPLVELESCTVIVSDVLGQTGSQVVPASSPAGGGTHLGIDLDAICPLCRSQATDDGQAMALCRGTLAGDGPAGAPLAHTFPTLLPPAGGTLQP